MPSAAQTPDVGAPLGVHAQQQRVVVEHLLEVRHHPVAVDASSARTRRPAGRGCRRAPSPPASRRASRRSPCRQQELQHHRRRELRARPRTPPTAGRTRPPGSRTAPSSSSRVIAPAASVGLLVQVLAQRRRDPGHLVAAGQPGIRQRLEDLPERRLPVPRLVREVGAREERVAVVVEHAGHRPAAVPGHRRGGLHVDRVDVRPLLAVHLDADEVLVEVRRRRLVLERLVRHHVAPVAGGVPDAQQHRHVAAPRLLERRRLPLPPVHRVVGVLGRYGEVALADGWARPPSCHSSTGRHVLEVRRISSPPAFQSPDPRFVPPRRGLSQPVPGAGFTLPRGSCGP